MIQKEKIYMFPDCKQYYNIKLTIKDLSSNVPTTVQVTNLELFAKL